MVIEREEGKCDPEDIELIPEEAYCHECGQIGCSGDGREREAMA